MTNQPSSSATAVSLSEATANSPLQGAILTAPRWSIVMTVLGLSTFLVGLICLQFGTERISVVDTARVLMHALVDVQGREEVVDVMQTILTQVRLPRVPLGFLVGSCLAAVGTVLQALLRNPLADPYVLGVSSGAALGTALAVLVGVGTTFFAEAALPACGFAGGLLALLVVYRMAATYGRLPVHSLLLAGVILNAIFSALIMFITSIMEPNRSFGMMAWLMGTLTAPAYPTLLILFLYLTFGLFFLFKQAAVLNILALGEESARALGVDTDKAKRRIFIFAALVTGAVVSVSGMIGF